MENSSSKTSTRLNSDFKKNFAEGDIDNKGEESGDRKETGVLNQYIAEEREGASGSPGDMMEVKLEYKTVEEQLLHPEDLKEKEEEETVETGKNEKVHIITI